MELVDLYGFSITTDSLCWSPWCAMLQLGVRHALISLSTENLSPILQQLELETPLYKFNDIHYRFKPGFHPLPKIS